MIADTAKSAFARDYVNSRWMVVSVTAWLPGRTWSPSSRAWNRQSRTAVGDIYQCWPTLLLHTRDRRLVTRTQVPRRRGDRRRRTRRSRTRHRTRRARARLRQRLGLHRPPVQGETRRARDHAPSRRLPRPESQAFIESWFGKLNEREVWLNEYETLDDARRGIGGYVDRYHQRPHSRLGYRTPYEVKETWEDLQNIAA
jgi:hypothetical protein